VTTNGDWPSNTWFEGRPIRAGDVDAACTEPATFRYLPPVASSTSGAAAIIRGTARSSSKLHAALSQVSGQEGFGHSPKTSKSGMCQDIGDRCVKTSETDVSRHRRPMCQDIGDRCVKTSETGKLADQARSARACGWSSFVTARKTGMGSAKSW